MMWSSWKRICTAIVTVTPCHNICQTNAQFDESWCSKPVWVEITCSGIKALPDTCRSQSQWCPNSGGFCAIEKTWEGDCRSWRHLEQGPGGDPWHGRDTRDTQRLWYPNLSWESWAEDCVFESLCSKANSEFGSFEAGRIWWYQSWDFPCLGHEKAFQSPRWLTDPDPQRSPCLGCTRTAALRSTYTIHIHPLCAGSIW